MNEGQNSIMVEQVSRAKSHNETAEKRAGELRALVNYIRGEHVGMIRGDGELTRYIWWLTDQICSEIANARICMNNANVPDELPF
jgi:hypothetical protein